ncbi:MAG: N-acetylmuramoyl-L-alanine amidase, partial [Acidobacteria bacterium]|nr:N-acetylmuramoyl-L-alanine amidase [Acidobacteriota bacterium]
MASAQVRVPVVSGGTEGALAAVLTAENELYLEAQPLRSEGLLAFARRLCGNEGAASEVKKLNGEPKRLLAGKWYRVPVELLTVELRRGVLRSLFPEDRTEPGGWRHRVTVRESLPDETLWRIAERFTGRGEHYREIRSSNGMADNTVYPGQDLLIPAQLLRPTFRRELEDRTVTVSSSSTGSGLPVTAEQRGDLAQRLEYGKDARGEYAIYRLKPGEALYSSVVVRYTGRIYAIDVNALAAEIAEFNGVTDVTDMPIGFPVKIPFDFLEPEFLPPGNPRRVEYEAGVRASEQYSNPVRSLDLAGITVILDAGHGGRDSGASKLGVWESTYVYDIMVRLKTYLEQNTAAEVFATTRDGSRYEIPDRDVLPYSRGHSVLTHPPYSMLEDPRVGVNLRWYLANSLFREAQKKRRDPEKVVFISIHADSLHPSLRGAMAYIPDAQLRKGSYSKSGVVYTSRREVREDPEVSFSWKHRVQSEGLSRQLADQIVGSFSRRGLGVHPDQPVRQKIYRGRRPWVPAVLRYNAVPASLLLEVCNLANDRDRQLLTSR